MREPLMVRAMRGQMASSSLLICRVYYRSIVSLKLSEMERSHERNKSDVLHL